MNTKTVVDEGEFLFKGAITRVEQAQAHDADRMLVKVTISINQLDMDKAAHAAIGNLIKHIQGVGNSPEVMVSLVRPKIEPLVLPAEPVTNSPHRGSW